MSPLSKPDKLKSLLILVILIYEVWDLISIDIQTYRCNNNRDIFDLCESNLHGGGGYSWYLPMHHKDSTHMHVLGVYVRDSLLLLMTRLWKISMSHLCFRWALLHSTTYIYFLYLSPSSLSSPFCPVVDTVSNNIDKALIRHPSANIILLWWL